VGADPADSSLTETRDQAPPRPAYTHEGQSEPATIRKALVWNHDRLSRFHWLLPLLEVPKDAAPPLAMTRPSRRVVDTYGWEAIEWIRQELGAELRWWQKLSIVRRLEHDRAGRLVWRTILESTPRRAGKSTRVRALALWRTAHADLFGEPQLGMLCGRDLSIAREIHRKSWRWATERQDWAVRKGVGQEEVNLEDGLGEHRWLVRSLEGTYGYDVNHADVDEAWDVAPAVVDDGLEPAMLERQSPQLGLTSTAHRRATSLMRRRIASAVQADDGETLLLWWGVLADADPQAPASWRAASPHWSKDRERTIRAKLAKALAAEDDPELDDPDPLQGFISQYLNSWRLTERRQVKGDPLTTVEAWADLVAEVPSKRPDAVAVESWYAEGCSLARAWRTPAGTLVSVENCDDLAQAADGLAGYRGQVQVGTSLAADPALKGLRLKPASSRTAQSVADLERLLREGALRHDGGEHLTAQVLAVRTTPSVDGVRLVSKGRADALKAGAWAVGAARQKAARSMRIVLPSGS
jgi:hypothetical protein